MTRLQHSSLCLDCRCDRYFPNTATGVTERVRAKHQNVPGCLGARAPLSRWVLSPAWSLPPSSLSRGILVIGLKAGTKQKPFSPLPCQPPSPQERSPSCAANETRGFWKRNFGILQRDCSPAKKKGESAAATLVGFWTGLPSQP